MTSDEYYGPSGCREQAITPASSPGLVGLDADVRFLLLCSLEVQDLRSLVRASKVFYDQFCRNEGLILRRSQLLALGNGFVDA